MITIGSNGIREMIRDAGKSKYRTPRPWPWWAWVGVGFALGLLLSPAHADCRKSAIGYVNYHSRVSFC